MKFIGLNDLDTVKVEKCNEVKKESAQDAIQSSVTNESKTQREGGSINKARTFTYAQLVNATDNFKGSYFLGEGGFGKVFKGKLEDSDQVRENQSF